MIWLLRRVQVVFVSSCPNFNHGSRTLESSDIRSSPTFWYPYKVGLSGIGPFWPGTNVRGGHSTWARCPGWSFDVSTNVGGAHLMWARMSGPVKNRVGTNVRTSIAMYAFNIGKNTNNKYKKWIIIKVLTSINILYPNRENIWH